MVIQTKVAVMIVATVLSTSIFSIPSFAADTTFGTAAYQKEFRKLKMMQMLDADGNHMVSLEEFNAFNSSVFDSLNKDSDDSLDTKEWVGVDGKQEVSFGTGGYNRQLRTKKMMALTDADGDHLVTKAEFLKLQESIFAKMDKSGDSQLDPQEWLSKQTGN